MPMGFIKEAVVSRKTTGAVVPSSSRLASAIVKRSNILHAKTVIELGPGTGVITDKIEKVLRKDSIFFAIELNRNLADSARKKYPNLTIYNGCATEIDRYMSIHGITSCDTIISGLPWASFPEVLQVAILDSIISVLAPGGEFVTFAYLGIHHLPAGRRIRKLLEERFSSVTRTRVIWKNVPPAFIYHCTK